MNFSTFAASSSVGSPVTGPLALRPDRDSSSSILTGKHCTLRPLLLVDAPALFPSLGGPNNALLYKYMPDGPLLTLESFTAHIKYLIEDPFWFAFTVLINSAAGSGEPTIDPLPVGIVCYLNIVPSNRTIEIGHVLNSALLQRTTAATEMQYLLLKFAFQELGYLRVEWKANSLNEPSKRAALRLGFTFEGVFRRHGC